MTTEARIDWAAHTTRLVDGATADRAWYQAVARELVAPGDRLAGDVGCGGAGMTLAVGPPPLPSRSSARRRCHRPR
ncbi:hypothetical protein O7622_22735 [Micromonospora sp. WMMD1076]|uniref:hypothetical protein n=1 Tax=Micromonospora sp. WMMD1076 TaxID=3016103 RepID=UPI00249BA135|nr:hypothetical protein [Micromonospora sp. WMMD1076]WFF05860.1 hypothetical protein O7622_22735 [Micromonospora sp. WMMD1076]